MEKAQPMNLLAKLTFWLFSFEIKFETGNRDTEIAIENVFGTEEQIKERFNDHSKTIRLGA